MISQQEILQLLQESSIISVKDSDLPIGWREQRLSAEEELFALNVNIGDGKRNYLKHEVEGFVSKWCKENALYWQYDPLKNCFLFSKK